MLASGAVLGLTDIDALIISMVRNVPRDLTVTTAAQAIAIGVLSNTILKMVLGLVIGRARFRRVATAGLAAAAVASAASIAWLR